MTFAQGIFDKLFDKYWKKLEKIKEEYDLVFLAIKERQEQIQADVIDNRKLIAQNHQMLKAITNRLFPPEKGKDKRFKDHDKRLYEEEQEAMSIHFK